MQATKRAIAMGQALPSYVEQVKADYKEWGV